jgi:hypothetical protein
VVYSFCTVVIGVGIGWFLGMSMEAITGSVLTAVLTVVTGTAGILAGVGIATERPDGATRADPILITLLVIGLVAGSILGTRARVNLWLRPNAKFIQGLTGIPEQEVNKSVFTKLYPLPPTTTAPSPKPPTPPAGTHN